MNEMKIIFNEETDEIIFSTNISENFLDSRFILSQMSDEKFQNLILFKAKQMFDYYKEKILYQDEAN